MVSLRAYQDDFAQALSGPVPRRLDHAVISNGLEREKRLDVYRNNVYSSLIDVLEGQFPVSCALVGKEFFRAMAGNFLRYHMPRSAVLIELGEPFPYFIATFEPALTISYLADVARLELLWSQAYHAAEAGSLDLQELAIIPAEEMPSIGLKLHPSVCLMTSQHPVSQIWKAHQDGPPRKGFRPDQGIERILVSRPIEQVDVRCLPTGTFTFLEALVGGGTLGEAAGAAVDIENEFDLQTTLQVLLGSGLFVGLERRQPSGCASPTKGKTHDRSRSR